MLCWFEAGVTASFSIDRLTPLRDGLGLLTGSACPTTTARSSTGGPTGGWWPLGSRPATPPTTVPPWSFTRTELTEVVTSRPGA